MWKAALYVPSGLCCSLTSCSSPRSAEIEFSLSLKNLSLYSPLARHSSQYGKKVFISVFHKYSNFVINRHSTAGFLYVSSADSQDSENSLESLQIGSADSKNFDIASVLF